jgi:hypothetical protein
MILHVTLLLNISKKIQCANSFDLKCKRGDERGHIVLSVHRNFHKITDDIQSAISAMDHNLDHTFDKRIIFYENHSILDLRYLAKT